MALPGVLGTECLGTEGALERVGWCGQGCLGAASLLDAPSLAALALSLGEELE